MAHEITIRANGFAEMAFVGETPWHSLGQSVKLGASIEEWARAAGMDWQAKAARAQFVRDDGTIGHADKKVIYRSDTGAALSAMGLDYQIVQPAQILEFFRDATESGGWHIHTAGTLQGGRKLWAMASQSGVEGHAAKGDRIVGNLLLSTSLDGTSPTDARMTSIRVVCANTLGAALRGSNGKRVRVSHRSQFDPSIIRDAMARAGDEFAAFLTSAQTLAGVGISNEKARDLLRELFAKGTPRDMETATVIVASKAASARQAKEAEAAARMARDAVEAARVAASGGGMLSALLSGDAQSQVLADVDADVTRLMGKPMTKDHRNVGRVMDLFMGAGRGSDHEGSRGTLWGLLNACTEFVDHEASRTQDTRLSEAWFGRGDDLKQRAFEIVSREAGIIAA